MADHRIATLGIALLTVGLVGAAAGLAPRVLSGRAVQAAGAIDTAAASIEPASIPDTLAFDIRYGGIGAEGVDMVWWSDAGGLVPGQVTLRMAYAGDPRDRKMPAWPVSAWLFYSAPDLRSSFAAELSGTINWRTGEMRAAGLVSDGARTDTALEYRMRVVQPGLEGSATVVFYPRMARAGR